MPVLVEGLEVPAGFAVTTQTVGAADPPAVQIVVTGLSSGDAYTVTGSAVGHSWAVRGGSGVSDGLQVVLTDLHTPLNVPITYTATVGDASAASTPVIVDYDGRYALQSLNGRQAVPFRWHNNGDPRAFEPRVASFAVPGRTSPVTVFDSVAEETGVIVAKTTGDATAAMKQLIYAGAPVVLRTDGALFDIAPVEIIHVTAAQNQLVGVTRRWQLTFVVVDDPEPDTIVSTSTWADVYAAYADLTWADVYAEFADSSWAAFYRMDWSARAAGS